MGRMHSRGKGISSSALPYKRTPPSWLKISAAEVEESICKFSKKGLTPSQIGVILRDSHGIAQVKSVTGNKILRILKAHGLQPGIPEDLYFLIKKAVAIRKHLERNKKDKDSKFRLILVESRIHRLTRYYKRTKQDRVLNPHLYFGKLHTFIVTCGLEDGRMDVARCSKCKGECVAYFINGENEATTVAYTCLRLHPSVLKSLHILAMSDPLLQVEVLFESASDC
ncbi:hypothetical protein C4D60_Mb06t03020 [Musa balbisiana]|uniref:Small ribosomal subunit protein uS15 N-terminal domain-containing protein n=1 Tax=Musa balbisiana TaxID=52838 RepID=A0A4S8IK92_MUSBA|nr:hypothetical protein C4D60_Mb06t03020 [Musa balbisiana]